MKPNEREIADEIARGWSDAEKHHVADPDLAICCATVEWARHDIIECVAELSQLAIFHQSAAEALKAYRSKWAEVLATLPAGVKAAKWAVSGESAAISIDLIAARMDYHPEKLRDALLGKLPDIARDFLTDGNRCPLCDMRKDL
ncbi:MAG TPA: hypothetical protein VMY37_10175 [Thermoguttaceae bacterium]|nr:hypothetical protein [Thermoguttaceae bacterium]